LLKIIEFLRMVDNLKKIGLLLGRKENGNISLIERCPLIVTHGI